MYLRSLELLQKMIIFLYNNFIFNTNIIYDRKNAYRNDKYMYVYVCMFTSEKTQSKGYKGATLLPTFSLGNILGLVLIKLTTYLSNFKYC